MGGLLNLVQRGGDWAGPHPAQAPPRCTKCNSPPIDGQRTDFVLLRVIIALGVSHVMRSINVQYLLTYLLIRCGTIIAF